MATPSSISNHAALFDTFPTTQSAAVNTASSGTGAATGSTISANDFLTLLVTEMKNQDPTANTDPNQYVNQLVQVNSLEQLININQTLSTSLGNPLPPPNGGMQRNPVAEADPLAGGFDSSASSLQSDLNHSAGIAAPSDSPLGISPSAHAISTTAGNLSVPAADPAAHRLAQALGHHSRHQ